MRKEEFLTELRKKLSGLPRDDLDNRISFYSEIIDDKIDEGKTEEEAVNEIGSVDEVVMQIASETPLTNLVKEKITPKRSLKAWEIVALILGFPLWFPLALTFLLLCLVAYLLVWILVIVVYAVEVGFAGSSIAGLIALFGYMTQGVFATEQLGMFILGIGLAILWVFVCIAVTKGTIKLSKKIILGIKAKIIKKGE